MIKKSLVVLLGFAVALSGCGKTSRVSTIFATGSESLGASTSSIDGVALPLSVRDQAVASPPPSVRHNYEIEEDGEYGYRQVGRADEPSVGVRAASLVKVRYKGVHRGIYAAELRQPTGGVSQMECKKPCHFARLKLIVDGRVLDSVAIPATGGGMFAAILDDMQRGRLRVYSPKGVHIRKTFRPALLVQNAPSGGK